MSEVKIGVANAEWQVTATTMECDMVSDYVTVIVNKDWSCKCTWWNRYKRIVDEGLKNDFSRVVKEKIRLCRGPECHYVAGYRDKLQEEENRM